MARMLWVVPTPVNTIVTDPTRVRLLPTEVRPMNHASMSSEQLLKGNSSTAASGGNSLPTVQELPGWLARVPGVKPLADRLGAIESRRRLLHMLPGFLPLLLLTAPHEDPWGPVLLNTTLLISISAIAFALVRASLFERPGEQQWSAAVLGYGLPVLGMLFLLPGRSELGLMTLGIIAFGDGSAALGGIAWGRRRLPWNRYKTWIGLICFVAVATVMSTLYYWMESRPFVSLGVALAISGSAALLSAIVESLPLRTHDNLRVGLTAALTGLGMHMLLLGW